MNTLKIVLQKLKKDKIKFSIVNTSELEKLRTNYLRKTDSANSDIKLILSTSRSAETRIEQALKSAEKMKSVIKKVEKEAKDLGVDKNNIKPLRDAYATIKEAQEYRKVLSTIKKYISSL